MMFAIWSGEEMGNLGSTNFLRQNKTPITAYLNMDMIGRLRTSLAMQGLGSAKQWKSIFEQLAPTLEAPVTTQDDPYLPTDAMAFYLKKIPTISFFTGSHAEYHTPRDTVDLINFEGLQKSLLVVKSTAQKLAESAQSLVTYQKVESKQSNLPGRSFRIYLGTIPDYTQEGAKGVKISGTTKDSPAEKAGLKEGDVIVELSGAKIQNLYDYVYALQALKPDQETPIKILRQGKLEEYKITPKLKE